MYTSKIADGEKVGQKVATFSHCYGKIYVPVNSRFIYSLTEKSLCSLCSINNYYKLIKIKINFKRNV